MMATYADMVRAGQGSGQQTARRLADLIRAYQQGSAPPSDAGGDPSRGLSVSVGTPEMGQSQGQGVGVEIGQPEMGQRYDVSVGTPQMVASRGPSDQPASAGAPPMAEMRETLSRFDQTMGINGAGGTTAASPQLSGMDQALHRMGDILGGGPPNPDMSGQQMAQAPQAMTRREPAGQMQQLPGGVLEGPSSMGQAGLAMLEKPGGGKLRARLAELQSGGLGQADALKVASGEGLLNPRFAQEMIASLAGGAGANPAFALTPGDFDFDF